MKYAVISLAGSQHRVEEKQKLTISRQPQKEGEVVTTDQVLLAVDDSRVEVGTPTLSKASVEYSITKHSQGPKLRVFKYKSKSRYRKTRGHRDQLTTITINKLTI